MDVNYILLRQQVETMRAQAATCQCSRRAHQALADLYRDRLRHYRGGRRPR